MFDPFSYYKRLPGDPDDKYIPGDDKRKRSNRPSTIFTILAVSSLVVGILSILFALYVFLGTYFLTGMNFFHLAKQFQGYVSLALTITDIAFVAGLIGLNSNKKPVTIAGSILTFIASMPLVLVLISRINAEVH